MSGIIAKNASRSSGIIGPVAGSGGGTTNNSVDTMTGDGSDTTLALSVSPGSENNVQITFDGVTQHHSTFSLSGSTITFSTAPPTGVLVEAVSGTASTTGTPDDGTVSLAKMAANSVDSDAYVDGSIDAVHLSANSVDSDSYVDASIDNAHLADDAVGVAELSATGTASSSTFLRGDNAWAAAGGGLVASNTVSGSAVTSFSFTGLDLDTDIAYIIEMEILADAGNNLFSIYANNLQTATDYRSQLIQATGTTVNSEEANNARIGYLSDGYRTRSIIHVGYSTGRYFYASAQFVRQHDSTTGFITINGVWKPTELVANVTRIDIVHSTSSGFDIGTKVRIYKR
jgi:hypothetical protein